MTDQNQTIRLNIELGNAKQQLTELNKAFDQQAKSADDSGDSMASTAAAITKAESALARANAAIKAANSELAKFADQGAKKATAASKELESQLAKTEKTFARLLERNKENPARHLDLLAARAAAKGSPVQALDLPIGFAVTPGSQQQLKSALARIRADAQRDKENTILAQLGLDPKAQSQLRTSLAKVKADFERSQKDSQLLMQLGLDPASTSKLKAELDKLREPEPEGGDGFFSGFKGKMTAIGLAATATVAIVKQGFDGLFSALDRGQVLNDLERSFEAIKDGTGATQVTLEGLQRATYGLLDSTTLLTQANTAMTLGLPGDELEELYQKTIQLARAQGVDSIRAIESITIGIARQSRLYLDNLGILIDLEKAQAKYAAANNTTAESLTDQQKQAAFYAATQEALNAKVKQTADVMLTAAERSQQFRVRLTDMITEFGQGVTQSQELSEAFAGIGIAMDKISFEQIGKSVGDLAGQILNVLLPPLSRAATLLEFINNTSVEPKTSALDDVLDPFGAAFRQGDKLLDTAFGWMADYNKRIVENREKTAKEFQLLQETVTEGHAKLTLHPSTGGGTLLGGLDQLDEKTKKALESFKKLGNDVDLKNLKQQIDNAIAGGDKGIFNTLAPQLEAEFKKVRTDELTKQLKDGLDKGVITAGQIAEQVNGEWATTGTELRNQMTKALDDTAKKSAESAEKISENLQKIELGNAFEDISNQIDKAVEAIDPAKFNELIPQFEASVYAKELAELRAQFKDAIGKGGSEGITEAKLSEMAAEEAKKAGDELRDELSRGVRESQAAFQELQNSLNWDEMQGRLEQSIKDLDSGAFNVIGQELEAQFKKVRFDELRKELGRNIGDPQVWDIVNREWAKQSQDMAKQFGDALDERLEASADFFSDVFYNALTGAAFDWEDTMKRILAGLAGGFLSQITGGFGGSLGDVQSLGQSIGKEIAKGIGGSVLGVGSGGQTSYLGMLSSILGGGGGTGGGSDALAAAQQVMSIYDLGNAAFSGGMVPAAAGTWQAAIGASGTAGAGTAALATGGFAAGAGLGYLQYRGVKGIAEGEDVGDLDLGSRAGLAILTLGFSELFNAVGLGSLDDFGLNFGSGKDENQRRRDAYRDQLFEMGVIRDPNKTGLGGRKAEFELFGGGYGSLSPGSEFRGVNEGAESFVGLGNLLSGATTGGAIDTDLAAMFANALSEADSFNAAVLTTRGLLNDMGIDAEGAGQMMVDAYYNGQIGLGELNAQLNTLTAVATEDLPSLADGVQLFTDSLDDPKAQIPALGLLFQEMAQEGIDSTEEMIAFFQERFSPEVAQSLTDIVNSGADSFDDLKNLTLGQTQLVLNELDSIAQSYGVSTDAVKQYGDEAEKAGEKGANAARREREEVEKTGRAYEDARQKKARFYAEGATQDVGPQPVG